MDRSTQQKCVLMASFDALTGEEVRINIATSFHLISEIQMFKLVIKEGPLFKFRYVVL